MQPQHVAPAIEFANVSRVFKTKGGGSVAALGDISF